MELLNLELLARSLEVNYRTTFRHHRGPFFWLINKASKIKLLCYQAHDVCSTDQKNDHEDNCLSVIP